MDIFPSFSYVMVALKYLEQRNMTDRKELFFFVFYHMQRYAIYNPMTHSVPDKKHVHTVHKKYKNNNNKNSDDGDDDDDDDHDS